MYKKVLIAIALVIALGSAKHVRAVLETPVITYMVNGVDGMTTIVNAMQGDTLNIVWSATNVAYCEKWGVWGAGERLQGLSGSESITVADPINGGVTGLNYQIDCYDATGLHIAQGGAQVNVSPALVTPTPTPTASPTPSNLRVKGEGQISELGMGYVKVGKTTILYDLTTQLRSSNGAMALGMMAKYEGTMNAVGSVKATKLDVK